MPRVSLVVELSVDVDVDMDPVAFERQVDAEGKRASRALYVKALQVQDDQVSAQAQGARQRLEPRWIATMFGRVRIHRYRIRGQDKSFHPLDRQMHLGQSEPSAAFRELVCDLAVRIPYRQAAELTGRVCGEEISPQAAWRVVQQEGGRLRDDQGRLIDAIFEDGEAPPEVDTHEFVVIEADGTYLKAQREGQPSFAVRTGVFYTGKEDAGGKRHRRLRLVNKSCYSTVADTDEFGKGLAAHGFLHLGIHKADWVLTAHDGLDEFGRTYRGWFPGAIHQIDHFHIASRLYAICRGDDELYRTLKKQAFDDPIGLSIKLKSNPYGFDELKCFEYSRYISNAASSMYGIDQIPEHLRQGPMRVVGTGVVEKHQDILVGRRMKKRGMRWTRRGADNLLALQACRFSKRWPQRWGAIAA